MNITMNTSLGGLPTPLVSHKFPPQPMDLETVYYQLAGILNDVEDPQVRVALRRLNEFALSGPKDQLREITWQHQQGVQSIVNKGSLPMDLQQIYRIIQGATFHLDDTGLQALERLEQFSTQRHIQQH